MKIAIIGSAHPLRGGLAAFNERLAHEYRRQGHEVVIYSFSLQYPGFLFPGKTQFTDDPAPAFLKIITCINSVNPINWVEVGKKINAENYDLIIVKYWLPFMGPAFGTILRKAKGTNTKVICIVDNIIPHENRVGDKMFTNYFIKPVDAFVTMSKDVLKDVKLFTDKPVFFTPHPIYDSYGDLVSKEIACKILKISPYNKYILFFGFIRDYKGLDILIEAMNDRRILVEDIRLIVAGEYYDKNLQISIKQQMEKYGFQDYIFSVNDFIPNNEVRFYFSACDLVVQPYKHATQSGITQIAYHFRKPMVVTDVGGLAEVVPDGKVGFVVQPDPKSIADAIIKFYQPNSLPDFEENILKEKEKYSWKTFTNVIFDAVK